MKLLSKCPPLRLVNSTGVDYSAKPPVYMVNDRPCTLKVYKRAQRRWEPVQVESRSPFPKARGVRARKKALLSVRFFLPCEHEWEYQEDDIGDPGVINGTYTECYLRCCGCGAEKAASYEDRPDYGDYRDDYEERW